MKEYLIYYCIFYITLRICCTIYLTFFRIEFLKKYKYIEGSSIFGFIIQCLICQNPFIRTLNELLDGERNYLYRRDYNFNVNKFIIADNYLVESENKSLTIMLAILTNLYFNIIVIFIILHSLNIIK